MVKLFDALKNSVNIHYFSSFPQEEQDEIIRRMKREFEKENVKEISGSEDWKSIKNHPQRIKIIRKTDEIMNKYGLGKEFTDMITDGCIYLLFSNEKFSNRAHKEEWLDFMQKPFLFKKYIFKPDKEDFEEWLIKIEKKCRYAAFFVTRVLFLILAIIYITSEVSKGKLKESLELVLYIGVTIGFLNAFFHFNVYDFIKKMEVLLYYFFMKIAHRFR